jgi:predicted hydrolase (HD superfamily)
MRALASKFKIPDSEAEKWYIVGLLHDGDYEFTKEDPANHAKLMVKWVKDLGETDDELLTGIESHGWFHEGKLPKTKMQWSLFCCDELTGLIVAVTLIRPTKKLADVNVKNIQDKWNAKSFAAGVKREDIENCEKELGVKLPEFIQIALTAMQGISKELGL